MFFQKLNEVTEQTKRKFQGRTYVRDYIIYAIGLWCNELKFPLDITDYIQTGYKQHRINELTDYIYQEWEPKSKERWTRSGWEKYDEPSKLHRIVNQTIFNPINMRSESVKFFVLIAFGITAIGYLIYILNHQKQQTTRGEEPTQDNPNPLATSVSTVQTITKKFLILVVSASQADFLGSLKDKRHIDLSDGEALYEITKYLWLDSENQYSQKIANVNQYLVSEGEKSEFDIYLVSFELNQPDEGFKPNVNQLARYDAFRKLAGLEIKISPRLQMEAYENFEVYNR